MGTIMQASSSDGARFDAAADMSQDEIKRHEAKVRSEFWAKFRRVAGFIPFSEDLVAAYYCALDSQTPLRVRGMLLGALVYFIMPFDIVPDFILGLGFTDDAAVLAAAVSAVARNIQPRHRTAAAKALGRTLDEDAPGTTRTS
jgi:uncharacterized membrane protein YkvA (DUF1232 family)